MRPVAARPAVAIEGVTLAFDEHVVLRDVSFAVAPGRMTIVLGASGSGKSVLLKLILGLLKPDAGAVWVDGRRVDQLSEPALMGVRATIGMLFQESALFDSLTVVENVGYRLYEETDLPLDDVRRRVEEVLGFIGLAEYIDRMPSELSGGQRRRVALARIRPWTTSDGPQPEFVMLKDGAVHFEGTLDALRASPDAYVRRFLT